MPFSWGIYFSNSKFMAISFHGQARPIGVNVVAFLLKVGVFNQPPIHSAGNRRAIRSRENSGAEIVITH